MSNYPHNKLSHSNSEERTEEFIRMKQSEIAAMISDDQEDDDVET